MALASLGVPPRFATAVWTFDFVIVLPPFENIDQRVESTCCAVGFWEELPESRLAIMLLDMSNLMREPFAAVSEAALLDEDDDMPEMLVIVSSLSKDASDFHPHRKFFSVYYSLFSIISG